MKRKQRSQPIMLQHILLAGLIWGGLQTASLACELLPTAAVQQAVGETPELEQRSQLPHRCSYSWRKANAAELEAQNQAQLRELSRRDQGYQPVSLWARLEAEVYFTAPSAEAARERFERTLRGDLPQRFGSPDLTDQSQFKSVDAQSAWSASNQQLLVLKGLKLYLLSVQVEAETDKNRELALKLVAGLP